MNNVERILEPDMRNHIEIDKMKFGFRIHWCQLCCEANATSGETEGNIICIHGTVVGPRPYLT